MKKTMKMKKNNNFTNKTILAIKMKNHTSQTMEIIMNHNNNSNNNNKS